MIQPAFLASALMLEKPPLNLDAVALSPTVGWWLFVCIFCLFVTIFAQGDRWRRFWLTMEDPRTIGLFRILFAFFVICDMNDFWEYFRMLFTSEGIFTADVVREVHASGQFKGYGDGLGGDPLGFFDWQAVWHYFTSGNKFSLLYFWDSPTFFWAHLVIFELITAMFMIGLWSRVTGVLSFFGMMSIFYRNHLFWEGTEVVYITMFVYLLCARSGHAYSVDNWLRCRKLRKAGLLSTRDGPGGGAGVAPCEAHPKGLQAIYRRIPTWPRRIMQLQMATVMTTTGLLKNGSVWGRGDAVYYAWNLDHFYRFAPQQLSSIIGTNLLRFATIFAHFGEIFFGLVIVGVVFRFAEGEPPLNERRRWITRVGFLGMVISSMMITVTAWPVHVTMGFRVEWFIALWLVFWALVWVVWLRAGYRPRTIKNLRIRIPYTPVKLPPITFTMDRAWLRKWTVGRRIWVTIYVMVMGGIFVLMNIGQFQTIMLTCVLVFLDGDELAKGLRFFGKRLARYIPWIPADVRAGEPLTPLEDPALPHHHRDDIKFPSWAVLLIAGAVFGGVAVRGLWEPTWPWDWIWRYGAVALLMIAGRFRPRSLVIIAAGFLGGAVLCFVWLPYHWWLRIWRLGMVALLVATYVSLRGAPYGRLPVNNPVTGRVDPPWAYGPLGRVIVCCVVTWHIAAVASWLMPDKAVCKKFRDPARKWFSPWMNKTYTSQGWGMFAPNPPRANVFLKVVVTDSQGQDWDMNTDMYSPEKIRLPFIFNDRMRKMNRRLVGKGKMYRKWYARWQCREWQHLHDGEIPEKIELIKFSYVIPTPEQVRDMGWYRPRELMKIRGRESTVHTESCADAIMGQLSNEDRARYGLPPLPEGVEHKPWVKHKLRKWERHLKSQERKREREDKKHGLKARRAKAEKEKQAAARKKSRTQVGAAARGGAKKAD